ncbi:MAG: putative addiction module antidote protein [Acidipropionibacterium acidipropionici]|nr:putative addiction module antidote protein [Acidipropionibacterium acidipropionici]
MGPLPTERNSVLTIDEKYPRFDAADYVTNTDDVATMLATALEDSATDPSALPTALGLIARSGNMSGLARRVGMSREGLYQALSGDGNPTWSTLVRIIDALGLRVEVRPAYATA